MTLHALLTFMRRGLAGFPLMLFPERDLKWSYSEIAGTWAYAFLAIHVLTACSTARVKSPFFPLNLSIVLNLSCFSSSSGSSTHIRPIFIHRFLFYQIFCARFDVSEVFPISELPDAKFHVSFCNHFLFTLFAYPRNV